MIRKRIGAAVLAILLGGNVMTAELQTGSGVSSERIRAVEQELVAKYGEAQRARCRRGLEQAARLWRTEDGDEAAFAEFVRDNFAGDQAILDTLFTRFERILEALDGHMVALGRELRLQADLNLGPMLPADEVFAGYDPSAHVVDDWFANKLAFTVLLNFPLTTLEQRLSEGTHWTRRQWAEARLAQRFGKRIPAPVNLAIARAAGSSGHYIAEYNIWMHHLLDQHGERLFPAHMRLLSHWNLRDQIKSEYAAGPKGLARQRMIQRVMEHIVLQTIPAAVVNNPFVDWNPLANTVTASPVTDGDVPGKKAVVPGPAREPDTRYAVLLDTYRASRLADPYSPAAPTLISRRFDENREIPEARFKAMLEQILSSDVVPRVAKLIEARLGRQLEPFDIWYDGFRPRSTHTEAELDALVSAKYPDAGAFERDIPAILTKLGFSTERAHFLAAHIQVDPARGSGHAMGASMRSDNAHLRTRVEKEGMNYKGFNIAVHELGHNVESVFSLHLIDHTLLQGVPNTAFTEAIAFLFQARDMELLGLKNAAAGESSLKTLNDFWMTYEIAGVALVDMGVWHWMYDHPQAGPGELKDATLRIAKDIWNRFYAPVLKKKDVVLLGIYSHMIDSFLYLPDYPLGHLIAHQIEGRVAGAGNFGAEIERITTFGSVAPDLWMNNATGSPVGAEALITATGHALDAADRTHQ